MIKENIIEKLKKLMSYTTVDGNNNEFDKLFDYIKITMPKHLIFKEYEFNGKKSLVLSNTEDLNLDVIFATHIDVVPAKDYSFKEDEKNVYGRGTIDMKGQVAVCLELLFNHEYKQKVAMFITSDEEIDGNCVKQLLKTYNTKLAIVPDGGNNFKLIEEEKGLLQLKVKVSGKPAHASQPYNGENAIIKAMNIYNELIKKHPLPTSDADYKTSINLSCMKAGEALNQVPFEAFMMLDIRNTSENTHESLIDEIKSFDCEVEVLNEGILFKTDVTNKKIQEYLEICNEILDEEVEILKVASTSDAIYFSEKNIPTILMNPYGNYAHCDNEYASKDGYLKLYEIYEKFMEKGEENE